MPDAALVIDAIGSDARSSLIDWYCALQLREYRRIFRSTDEAGQLDNVARRFAWFRRVLRTHDEEHAPAFLEEWRVGRWLVARFVEITRDDLKSALVRSGSGLQVAVLLDALNASLEFETALVKKYGVPVSACLHNHVFQSFVSIHRCLGHKPHSSMNWLAWPCQLTALPAP